MTTGGKEFQSGKALAGLSGLTVALSESGSPDEVFVALGRFVRALGFPDLIFTVEAGLPGAGREEARWSTLAGDRLAAVDAGGFDGDDPIRRAARRTGDPIVWTADTLAEEGASSGRALLRGFREAAIEGGVTAAIWGSAGRMAMLDAFATVERIRALPPAVGEALHLGATAAYRAVERLGRISGGGNLTRREIETLDLAARGLTTPVIARRLRVAEPTVKFHLKSVREKLGARTKAEAIARFTALDWLAPKGANETGSTDTKNELAVQNPP